MPFSIATSYMPVSFEEVLRGAAAEGRFGGDWYELLEGLGFDVRSSTVTVEAVVADGITPRLLDVDPGAPVVLFTRITTTAAGSPLEVGFVRVRADRVVLEVPLDREVDR